MRITSQFVAGLIAGSTALAVGMFLGAAGPGPKSVPGVIQAKRFEVVDELGTVVLVIGANNDGGSLSVRNRYGKTLVLAGASEYGGSLVVTNTTARQPAYNATATEAGGGMQLLNAKGKRIFEALAGEAGGTLHIANQAGQVTATLESTGAGIGTIATFAEDGRELVRLLYSASGGVIETYNRTGQRLVSLSATVGHHGQIATFGDSGHPLVMLTATGTDEGQLYTYSGDGRIQVAIASRASGPSLRVFNQHGEAVVTLESDEQGRGVIGAWDREGSGRTLTPAP